MLSLRASFIFALAILALSVGCGNPACNREVITRLVDECAIIFSIAQPICSTGNGPASYSREIDYFEEACEIIDPPQDAECLRFHSCQDVIDGVCRTEDAPLDPTFERRTCLDECSRVVNACATECQNRAETDACYDCGLDCTRRLTDCEAACPAA